MLNNGTTDDDLMKKILSSLSHRSVYFSSYNSVEMVYDRISVKKIQFHLDRIQGKPGNEFHLSKYSIITSEKRRQHIVVVTRFQAVTYTKSNTDCEYIYVMLNSWNTFWSYLLQMIGVYKLPLLWAFREDWKFVDVWNCLKHRKTHTLKCLICHHTSWYLKIKGAQ